MHRNRNSQTTSTKCQYQAAASNPKCWLGRKCPLCARATQTITLVLPKEPGHAGVDPRSLLIDVRPRDNFAEL